MKKKLLVIICFIAGLLTGGGHLCSQVFIGLYDSLLQHFTADTLFSVVSAQDIVYQGIDNEFVVNRQWQGKGFHADAGGGLQVEMEGNLIQLRTSRDFGTKEAILRIIDGSSRQIYARKLIIQTLPPGSVFIGHSDISRQSLLLRQDILSADSIYFFYGNWIAGNESWNRVIKYSLGYNYGSYYISRELRGNHIDARTRNLLLGSKPGQEFGLTLTIEGTGSLERETSTYPIRIY